ncbi:MAG: TauD/TfdA family dioxygenase [Gammaproteobacteria bacterium]|nr:TauD/TfdA family dioxygenase [Gammaproteobacteria bacterium]
MRFSDSRRRAVTLEASGDWLDVEILGEREFLACITPRIAGIHLADWLRNNPDWLADRRRRHGALLFRGFDIGNVARLNEVVNAATGAPPLEYRYRASPRHALEKGYHIYTSTDYPAHQAIFLHNEHAFSREFPAGLFFCCLVPPGSGGETPLGDNRWITECIPRDIRERFDEHGVLYERNFNHGFGLTWQRAFGTGDRDAVERECARREIECTWSGADQLQTLQKGPAMVCHPRTGERLWFNHATFFNALSLPAAMKETLTRDGASVTWPTQTYYGNGEEIEDEVIECLRGIYIESRLLFPWRHGDVLFLDNLLGVHGRMPFGGDRRIAVAMSEICSWQQLAADGQA